MTTEAPERPYHALSVIPDIDQQILAGIAAGKSLKVIADEYGVHDTAILRRAQKHPEYKDSLAIGTELRMDEREKQLEDAPDNVSVTRADRLLGHARWIAERACPDRWGQKTQLTGDLKLNVTISRGIGTTLDMVDVTDAAHQQVEPITSITDET